MSLLTVSTTVLDIAYERHGAANGRPIVLLHGFPYDVRCFDEVAPYLEQAGLRIYVPFLRGFGATRFRSAGMMRSGEQAALAHDLLEFIDTLRLERPLLAGFDWGGRAAVAAAILWPERFRGIMSTGGYTLYDVAAAAHPCAPEVEAALWYQFYFLTDRAKRGLLEDRRSFCKWLWRSWSPGWNFDEAAFEATAISLDNPDFVDVALHSYRHRLGAAPGDPAYATLEARLAVRPPVDTPAIVLSSGRSSLPPAPPSRADMPNLISYDVVDGAGHNLPQERPEEFAQAILTLDRETR